MATRAEIMAKPKYAVAKYGSKDSTVKASPNLSYSQYQKDQELANRGIGSGRTETLTNPVNPNLKTTTNRTETLYSPTSPITELGTSSFVTNPELERLGLRVSSGLTSISDLTDDERTKLEDYYLNKSMSSSSYDPEAEAKKAGDALVNYYKDLEEARKKEYYDTEQERQRADAQKLSAYQSQLETIYAPRISQANRAGEAREEDFRRDTGFRGFTRSGYLVEGVQEIEQDTQAELAKIQAERAAQEAYYAAQLEGATGEVLSALKTNWQNATAAREQQTYDNLIKQQELRAKAIEAGDTASLNMLNSLAAGDGLGNVDWETSAQNGYLVDMNGNLVTNNAGTPQEYNPYEYSTVGGSLYKIDKNGNATLVVGKSGGGGGSGSGASSDLTNYLAQQVANGQMTFEDVKTLYGQPTARAVTDAYSTILSTPKTINIPFINKSISIPQAGNPNAFQIKDDNSWFPYGPMTPVNPTGGTGTSPIQF